MTSQKLNVHYKYFAKFHNCKKCGLPLIMFGCKNKNCVNYHIKNIKKLNILNK